jgi:hypothetical protein
MNTMLRRRTASRTDAVSTILGDDNDDKEVQLGLTKEDAAFARRALFAAFSTMKIQDSSHEASHAIGR